jgi:Ca2+/H+ antiporter, TMEM165/GDT1 family
MPSPSPAATSRSGSNTVAAASNAAVLTAPSADPEPRPAAGGIALLASTFVTVFLAELGDKTQIATLLLSAQSGRPWLVFAGAATALVATSLLGVLAGRWLARWLPPQRLELLAGGLMLILGVWLGLGSASRLLHLPHLLH